MSMLGINNSTSNVIGIHKGLVHDHRVQKMYSEYVRLLPLNINSRGKKSVYWKKHSMFCSMDFARLIQMLINSQSIDEFIKFSMADFDNIAMVIKVALENKFVSVSNKGIVTDCTLFKTNELFVDKTIDFVPNNDFNQFPCDENSRLRRAEFLINRYPFVKDFRFAILGEDDFLSPLFKNLPDFCPVILEKDTKIIKQLKQLNKNAQIYEVDLVDDYIFEHSSLPHVRTFITDPPYTLHGVLTFIYRGLSLLSQDDEMKEFYVVLNPTMMGKNLDRILSILSKSEVSLHEVINNFSQYKLPKKYKEFQRANDFLCKVNLPKGIISYSSSSSLYVFRTTSPKINMLKKHIDYNKIYEHYL